MRTLLALALLCAGLASAVVVAAHDADMPNTEIARQDVPAGALH